jgi:uncharacterized protein YciI
MADTRRALLPEQKSCVRNFCERVIGYGHFVSDDGRDTLGTAFFMQLDDRAAADAFIADEPLNKAGVYQRVEVHRWSNSFGKRAADYCRKGMQQFLCGEKLEVAGGVEDYDHIVIGGGAAGCPLAARLSERASARVPLIEAGTDYPPGQEPPEILDIFAATVGASTKA